MYPPKAQQLQIDMNNKTKNSGSQLSCPILFAPGRRSPPSKKCLAWGFTCHGVAFVAWFCKNEMFTSILRKKQWINQNQIFLPKLTPNPRFSDVFRRFSVPQIVFIGFLLQPSGSPALWLGLIDCQVYLLNSSDP